MENVSEDAFSAFLKNEIRYIPFLIHRFEVTPQQQEDFEFEPPKFVEPILKSEEHEPLIQDLTRPPLPYPFFPEELSLSATEKMAVSAVPAFEIVHENMQTPPSQPSLVPAPAPIFLLPEGTMHPCSPPAKEKRGVILKSKRPVPCQEKKPKDFEYEDSSSDLSSRDDGDKKKKRLERNRKSARESRRRKKEYIHNLEIQVKLFS